MRLAFAVVAACAGLVSMSAHAQLANPGFEDPGLAGWTVLGTANQVTSAIGSGPTEGTSEALVEAWNAHPSRCSLETSLGLESGSLHAVGNGLARRGSAIAQSFTALAGQVLTFDCNFLTNESTPAPGFDDFAFMTLSSSPSAIDLTANGVEIAVLDANGASVLGAGNVVIPGAHTTASSAGRGSPRSSGAPNGSGSTNGGRSRPTASTRSASASAPPARSRRRSPASSAPTP